MGCSATLILWSIGMEFHSSLPSRWEGAMTTAAVFRATPGDAGRRRGKHVSEVCAHCMHVRVSAAEARSKPHRCSSHTCRAPEEQEGNWPASDARAARQCWTRVPQILPTESPERNIAPHHSPMKGIGVTEYTRRKKWTGSTGRQEGKKREGRNPGKGSEGR